MTIVAQNPSRSDFRIVAFDMYRDVHKGIRSELFAVTEEAGRIDPADPQDRAALGAHLGSVVQWLMHHAEHEDAHVLPTLQTYLPESAERIERDHAALDDRLAGFAEAAGVVAASGGRTEVHRLYLELASFTSAYLEHQDLEERSVMPALDAVVGVEAVRAMHAAILASIPPAEIARGQAAMFPAMNVDDRTELLAGIRANAPAEVFERTWSLAASVLSPRDLAAVAARLG